MGKILNIYPDSGITEFIELVKHFTQMPPEEWDYDELYISDISMNEEDFRYIADFFKKLSILSFDTVIIEDGNYKSILSGNDYNSIYLSNINDYPEYFLAGSGFKKAVLKNVSEIKCGCFFDCASLDELNADDTECIGEYAFSNCVKLQKAVFPFAVKLGKSAFGYCEKLSEINMPEIVIVAKNAFIDCKSLKTAKLEKAELLKLNAFKGCKKLESLKIPLVTKIENEAFYNCLGLTNLEFNNLEEADDAIFKECAYLSDITFYKLKALGYDFFCNCSNLYSVNADCGKEINAYAFKNCISLNSVNIKGVKKIYKDAFESCDELRKVFLGSEVPAVHKTAFHLKDKIEIHVPAESVYEYLAAEPFNDSTHFSIIVY